MAGIAWHTLCAAHREHRLATTGIYARIRHPQYVTFFIIMIGLLFQWPTLVTLAMFPILVWVYVRIARGEDAAKETEFGEMWPAYVWATPPFIPRLEPRAPATSGQM